MKPEVEVISKEIVKPSSATPEQLRSYQLSFFDLQTPRLYNPFVFFYPKICDTETNKIKTSDHLKQSISNALTYFYPLAGRFTENQLSVDCNDKGISFSEARVKYCQFSDVVDNPDPCEMNKFLPFKIHDTQEFLLGIQFNVFECGGIGIGVCISHTIGDALSFFMFVNTWAAIARGEKKSVTKPEFVSASIFPPRGLSAADIPSILRTKEKIVVKRFVFSASKTEEIRGKCTADNNQTRPTRVEALSAFIWTRFVNATYQARSRPDHKLFSIGHMINLRTRMDPPQPAYSFGNLSSFSVTFLSMGELSCHNIVTKMKDSIKEINNEFVKKIQNGYNHLAYVRERTAGYEKGELVPFAFTSLCRFPIYDADFGWGKPIWAGSASRDLTNSVVFMDTVDSNGIEAWVALKEDDMENFGSDKELLAYVGAPKRL